MRSLRTTARAIKISLVIDATPFVGLVVPDNQGRVALPVDVAGRTVRANLAPKAVRKACKALADNPQGTIVLLLSGRLEADNTLADAGLVAQARTPKPQSEAPAEAVA